MIKSGSGLWNNCLGHGVIRWFHKSIVPFRFGALRFLERPKHHCEQTCFSFMARKGLKGI